jgi:hypothetical protein
VDLRGTDGLLVGAERHSANLTQRKAA